MKKNKDLNQKLAFTEVIIILKLSVIASPSVKIKIQTTSHQYIEQSTNLEV